MAPWAVAVLLGATICFVCDHLHVTEGVLAYTHPVLWRQAWWVFPLFVGSTLVALTAARGMRRLFGGRPFGIYPVVADVVAFATAYAFTAFAHTLPDVVLWVLVAAWIARVAGGTPAWLVVYTLVSAAVGPAFEATLSRLGWFHYQHPDFLGVPRWLPALYLHIGFVAANLERRLPSRRAAQL
jgi:hypothetical protein